MKNENNRSADRLIEIVALAKSFCDLCESSSEFAKAEFIDRCLDILPRLYWNFFDLEAPGVALGDFDFFSSYVDEELYEDIRGRIAALLGEDDVFLDTFEQDMKYSDTPISVSMAESMADIFQPLYNFISIVKDSEGMQMEDAYINCKEDFENYWSQTLCNLLKALNNLKYNNSLGDEDYDR